MWERFADPEGVNLILRAPRTTSRLRVNFRRPVTPYRLTLAALLERIGNPEASAILKMPYLDFAEGLNRATQPADATLEARSTGRKYHPIPPPQGRKRSCKSTCRLIRPQRLAYAAFERLCREARRNGLCRPPQGRRRQVWQCVLCENSGTVVGHGKRMVGLGRPLLTYQTALVVSVSDSPSAAQSSNHTCARKIVILSRG